MVMVIIAIKIVITLTMTATTNDEYRKVLTILGGWMIEWAII